MVRKAKSTDVIRRDELGVSPLYWARVGETVVVSDNLNELFMESKLPRKLRREMLGEYFAQGWICEPDTIWEGVHKIPAGCELVVNDGRCEVRRWWSVSGGASKGESELKAMIAASVDKALEGDKKVCNWFSGGIDSSLLAAFTRTRGLKHLHMTMGDAESERVKRMEAVFGLDVERLAPEVSLIELYPELCRRIGEPIADPGIIAAYWLSKESVDRGCTAVLCGMGGDEIDAGYPRARIVVKMFSGAAKLIPWRIVGFALIAAGLLLKGKRKRDFLRLGNFMRSPDVSHYFNLFGYFTKTEIDKIIGKGWFSSYQSKVNGLTAAFRGKKRFFAYEFMGFLASHNNIYGARACAEGGVECRMPLLAPDVVQTLWPKIDARHNAGKRRLSKVLSDELGPSFVKVRKSGFRFPVEQKLKDVDWRMVRDRLRDVVQKAGLELFDQYVVQLKAGAVDEVYMKLWAFWTLSNFLGPTVGHER